MTKHLTAIGIDPGAKGGIAFIDGEEIKTIPMPMLGGEIDLDALHVWLMDCHYIPASNIYVLEWSQAFPKMGKAATFKFAAHWGMLRGYLAANRESYVLVRPQEWKRLILKGYDKKRKDSSILYVKRRFPDVDLRATPKAKKPSDGIADAICMALYGLQQAG